MKVKKLVSVLAIFTLVTGTREETVEIAELVGTAKTGKNSEESNDKYPENLAQVPHNQYPITFRKKSVPVSPLFDSGSEVTTIHPIFVRELGLLIRPTDVRA